jgi:hypothetical protein
MIAEFMPRALVSGVRMPLFISLMMEDVEEAFFVPAAASVMPEFRTLARMSAPSAALSVEPAATVELEDEELPATWLFPVWPPTV